MTQLLIDLEPRQMADTSLEAFEHVREHLTQLELTVAYLVHSYCAATGHADVSGAELAAFSGMSLLSIRPRATGLLGKGWLAKGEIRPSRVHGERRVRGVRLVVPLASLARISSEKHGTTSQQDGTVAERERCL